MNDQMTPRERTKALAEGRPVDRVPHGFSLGDAAARVTGIKVSEYHRDAKKQIEAQIASYRRYGLDGLGVFALFQDVFGAETVYPDQSTPMVGRTAALEGDDLKRDYIGDPRKNPHLAVFWDVLDGLFADPVTDEVPVSVFTEGPYTLAGRVIGVDTLLKKSLRDPEYVIAVLGKVSDAQVALVEALAGYDVSFGIMDPVSSGDLISHDFYLKFSKPYHAKLFNAMRRVSGSKPMIHICGDSSKIWRDAVDVGAGAFSVDNRMDLAVVKKAIGEDIAVSGNVKPSETMLLGSPGDVRADLRECFRKAWDTPAGYVPGFGCGLPIDTPAENLEALFDELGIIGKFPVDPERFN
jgi:uroporphyrinogen decarboxylase